MSGENVLLTVLACQFLDQLEALCCQSNDDELPVKFVMRRIQTLLARRLRSSPTAVAEIPPHRSRLEPDASLASSSYSQSSTPTTTSSYDSHPNRDGGGESERRLLHATTHSSSSEPQKRKNNGGHRLPRRDDVLVQFERAVDKIAACETPIYADIQCLNSTDGYVIKEFSATSEGCPTAWCLVKSPAGAASVVADNHYLRHKKHGIEWGTGFVDEERLRTYTRRIFTADRPVYVKGIKKSDMLVSKLDAPRSAIKSLDDFPNLSELRTTYPSDGCQFHKIRGDKTLSCTTKHVHALQAHHSATEWL